MASTIPGRNWRFDPSSWRFRWSISQAPVLHPSERSPVYLAPKLWGRAVARKPRWLVLGGAWYQPPVIALALASPARSSRLLWVEAVEEAGTKGRAVEALKRMVRRRMDGAVVPGLSSARVVESWSRGFPS